MSLSAWFIGSITIPAQTVRVSQGGFDENIVLAAGTYYLRHATAGLSLIDALATLITSHSTVSVATCTVRRNRTIVITSAEAITLNWPADNVIRNLLGYDADLTPAGTSFTAANISPLLFSPGYLATPRTIEGVDGYTIPHQAIRKSSDGTQVQCDHYGQETWQDLSWTHIMPERLRVAASANGGGTFHEFFEQCAMLRRRFLWHQEIDEDDASTSAVTYDTARGPYVLRPEIDGDWYRRNVPFAEVSSPLDLPMHMVAEYT